MKVGRTQVMSIYHGEWPLFKHMGFYASITRSRVQRQHTVRTRSKKGLQALDGGSELGGLETSSISFNSKSSLSEAPEEHDPRYKSEREHV